MKTTLVVKDWSGQVARAAMPDEAPSTYHSILKHSPAHKAMVSHGFKEAKKEHQPESVEIRNNRYHPKAGKLERIRKLPKEVVDTLEMIDAARGTLQDQIRELNQKEQSLLVKVYEECPPVKMTEVRGFKNV